MRTCATAGAAPRPEPFPRRRACALALTLALAACSTQPTHPTPPPAPPTPPPAAAPAPAPAPEAKKPKPKAKAAALPAATPAATAPKASEGLALADVGYYMDVMQGRLQQLAASGVAVSRQGTRVVVTASATFDAAGGRLEVDPAHARTFAAIAKVLAEYRQTRVTLRVRQAAPAGVGAACEAALQRYLVGAGVAPQQLAPGAATPGDVPSTATATLDLDIAPLVREG